MASASASLFKPSTRVLEKSEWVKGQSLRQPSVSLVRVANSATSSLVVRAGSYADELVKTAVCNCVHHSFLRTNSASIGFNFTYTLFPSFMMFI